MIAGLCVVCQFQESRTSHQVMGSFDGLAMCHWHLLDARNGMMAASLLHAVQLSVMPNRPALASVGEAPDLRKPTAKAMQIVERLKRGDDRKLISRNMNVSTRYIARVKRNFMKGVPLPSGESRLTERTKKIIEMLKSGARVVDIAREANVTHSYVSQIKKRHLEQGDGQ